MEYQKEINITECSSVYPPAEDTFLLLQCLDVRKNSSVLEMGCGTGLISCHIAHAGALLTAADINEKAVQCTKHNLENNGLAGKVVRSDLFQNITGRFDAVVFNPPYLSEEEEGGDIIEKAWAGGPTGTEVLSKFLDEGIKHLSPDGKMTILFSSEMEMSALDKLLAGYSRRRLGSRRCFFEELWVEEIRPQL